jgi:tetratricopeptide (TPR) repeat protein
MTNQFSVQIADLLASMKDLPLHDPDPQSAAGEIAGYWAANRPQLEAAGRKAILHGNALFERAEFALAREAFQRAFLLAPGESAKSLFFMAVCEDRAGRPGSAIPLFAAAYMTAPRQSICLYHIGLCLLQLGHREWAEKALAFFAAKAASAEGLASYVQRARAICSANRSDHMPQDTVTTPSSNPIVQPAGDFE